MKKLSKKQTEVIELLKEKKTFIIYMKGISPHCFVHSNLRYSISIATMFALEKLKIIEERNSEWNASEYHLTELTKK